MLFDEGKMSQGAEVWARTMHLSPDECVDVIPTNRSKILPPPQRKSSTIAESYIKHEEEVIKCESKLNNWFDKFESASKRTYEKVQKDERLTKYIGDPVQKAVQNTLTPEVKSQLRGFVKKAGDYVETQTNRIK